MTRPNVEIEPSLVERATHDLLNPIASLLGLGETLAARGAGLDDATVRSFGTSLARQTQRLESGIRDLAYAEMLRRGDPAVHASAVKLREVLNDLPSERVRVEVPDDLSLTADRQLLRDSLARLIHNALRFSADEVTVRAGIDGVAWIEIEDSGTGFTDEELAGAFAPLSAGANARNDRAGLGLGLYIARRAVEAQGGTLTATSTAGKGSVFRIDFPPRCVAASGGAC